MSAARQPEVMPRAGREVGAKIDSSLTSRQLESRHQLTDGYQRRRGFERVGKQPVNVWGSPDLQSQKIGNSANSGVLFSFKRAQLWSGVAQSGSENQSDVGFDSRGE